MKKLFSILTTAAMLLSLCALTACGEKPAEDATDAQGDAQEPAAVETVMPCTSISILYHNPL